MTHPTIESLDDLYTLLTTCPACLAGADPIAIADGDAPAHTCGELDWTALPTFGGQDLAENTSGIWSWDATRLLVGESASDLRIVYRQLRVYTEGDEWQYVDGATSLEEAARQYARGQDFSDFVDQDGEVLEGTDPGYEIWVQTADGHQTCFDAEIAPSGRGRLR